MQPERTETRREAQQLQEASWPLGSRLASYELGKVELTYQEPGGRLLEWLVLDWSQ